MKRPYFIIGSRGSPLALRQAAEVQDSIVAFDSFLKSESEDVIITPIVTTGDRLYQKALADFGGKGLFTKEIDEALLTKRVDLAVHSAKDLPTQLPEGLEILGFMQRGDVRDAFISRSGLSLKQLSAESCIGTASLRRQAQVKRVRPDLNVVVLRGNVETRLRKMNTGDVDAIVLAAVALERLKLSDQKREILDIDSFLPAVGQGAIALVGRVHDEQTRARVSPLIHHDTTQAIHAERAFLEVLDGSCRTPIAGYAHMLGEEIIFQGAVFSLDGQKCWSVTRRGLRHESLEMARCAAHTLIQERLKG
jgi:hydroxymethylbilane synthase